MPVKVGDSIGALRASAVVCAWFRVVTLVLTASSLPWRLTTPTPSLKVTLAALGIATDVMNVGLTIGARASTSVSIASRRDCNVSLPSRTLFAIGRVSVPDIVLSTSVLSRMLCSVELPIITWDRDGNVTVPAKVGVSSGAFESSCNV